MSEHSKPEVKGYVVRGTNQSGTVGYAVGRDGTLPTAVANYLGAKTVYTLLDVADSAAVDLRREGCTGVRVYRVHADGSETPMPTYTELAVKARNPAMGTKGYVVRGKYRDEPVFSIADDGWSVDADWSSDRPEQWATIHVALSAQVLMGHGGCTDVTIFAVAEDGTETPLPSYKEAVTQLAAVEDALVDVHEDLTGEPLATRVGSLAAALAVADADMFRAREVLGCKVEEETHTVAARALAENERLRGDNEAQRFRAVEAEAAAFSANEEVERLRAEIAHLKAHAATLPIALAPVPLGDTRPAVMGGECSACLAAPPYHEDTCKRRTATTQGQAQLSILREMASAALDWQRHGGMRPNHPPELAGCPVSALREILRVVGRDVPAPTDSHDLTPSQVALSIALGAWETWPGDRRDQSAEAHALRDLGETFKAAGLAVWTGAECVLTDEGRALLARARAAGVLGVSTEETARLRGELDLKTAVLKMRDDKIAALQAVLASGAPDVPLSTAERAAWARYVNAAIDDRDAQIAEEHYQDGAEEGRARTKAALDAATDALRALCVDVDALLSAAEGR